MTSTLRAKHYSRLEDLPFIHDARLHEIGVAYCVHGRYKDVLDFLVCGYCTAFDEVVPVLPVASSLFL